MRCPRRRSAHCSGRPDERARRGRRSVATTSGPHGIGSRRTSESPRCWRRAPERSASIASLTLKLELLQHTGSFKLRGRVQQDAHLRRPGRRRDRRVRGELRPRGRVRRARARTSRRDLHPGHVARREDRAGARAGRRGARDPRLLPRGERGRAGAGRRETGALWMHPFDQPEVVAGGGTVGWRSRRRCRTPTPCSSRSAGAGSSPGSRPGSAATSGSWASNRRPVRRCTRRWRPALRSRCRSAASRPTRSARAVVGDIAFDLARSFVDRVVLVAGRFDRGRATPALERVAPVAEPGGAASLAALLSGAYRPAPGERVVRLVCGANTDPASVV